MPLASQSPYPIIVYSVANYRPHLNRCNFIDPNFIVAFYFIYLINPLNTLLFTYSTNIQVRFLTVNMENFLTPKIRKCTTP